MQSLIQVFRVNDKRSGVSTKTQRAWEMQDAEIATLDDGGQVVQVGTLQLSKDMMAKGITPGVYMGSFALMRNNSQTGQGRIEAVLVGLQPYAIKAGASPASATPGAK